MASLINEIGNTYGQLTVLSRADNTSLSQARWLCRCECGNALIVRGTSFRRKRQTKSCGCLRRKHALPNGIAARHKLQYTYKRQANKRGFEWELSPEMFKQFTSSNCHYCGIEPKQIQLPSGDTGAYLYNGLDRVDNSKGYLSDNIVPCCGTCNKAKGNMDYQKFMEWVAKVYHYCAPAVVSA